VAGNSEAATLPPVPTDKRLSIAADQFTGSGHIEVNEQGRSSRDRPPDAATARESYPLAELTDLHQQMEVAATMRATSLPRRKTPMMSPAATRSKHGAAFFRS
jgi:hypothetical protein